MDVRDKVLARAELLVAHIRILHLKATEALLAPEVSAIMLCDVTHQSGEIFDQREVTVLVEQVDFGLAHMPTLVKRVPSLPVIVVEPDHGDRDVELLLDPRKVGRTYGVLNRIKPVLQEVNFRVS